MAEWHALDSGDLETAIRITHTLKGLSGQMGSMAVPAAAARLEQALKDDAAAAGITNLLAGLSHQLDVLITAIRDYLDRPEFSGD